MRITTRKNLFGKTLLIIAMMALGSGLIIADRVSAEENVASSMFVTPMSQEMLLVPGEKYEGVISVSNSVSSQEDLRYKIAIGSYGIDRGDDDIDDYAGGIDVTTTTARNVMMDWITIDKDSGLIEPNGTDKITYTIDVPENAPAGAQYATILVIKDDATDDNIESEGITMQSVYQIASRIIANVAGETIEKGTIADNSIPSFLLSNNLEVTSMVKNEGNVYTNAEYTLQVWPVFSDEEICTNEESPEANLILPDTERYHTQTCNLPSVGIFRAKQTVKIFGEESTVEKMVIVCPIWLLFLIFFIIAVIIIWIIMRVRQRNNASKRKASAE